MCLTTITPKAMGAYMTVEHIAVLIDPIGNLVRSWPLRVLGINGARLEVESVARNGLMDGHALQLWTHRRAGGTIDLTMDMQIGGKA